MATVSVPFRVANKESKVFKDECMLCFHTPFFPGGLFVCLETFCGLCRRHVSQYAENSAHRGFLHIQRTRIEQDEKKKEEGDQEPRDKVTRLAIGVEGGFDNEDKVRIEETNSLVIYPDLDLHYPLTDSDSSLDPALLSACQALVANEGALRLQQLEAGVSAWDGEAKVVTRHAHLVQVDNGRRVALSGWSCEESGCTVNDNLWLNLSDGSIKCGRSQYIGPGIQSQGNNHMRQHFDRTGYPLVVKLGTITAGGEADVYSYDEDESVIDPNLKSHLLHFGIDIAQLEKTHKSTLEMELDLNQKWEWAAIQEDGANLEAAYGPGMTGMVNIGSSCYINASIQTLCLVPDFVRQFDKGHGHFPIDAITPEMHEDFNAQTAKLVRSLQSGDYAQKDGGQFNAIKPLQFRRLVGRGHAEFSTARQQDAEEYIRYLLEKIAANVHEEGNNPVDAVRFELEDRLLDNVSGRVRYRTREEVILPLEIAVDRAINLAEVQAHEQTKTNSNGGETAVVRPRIRFADCLERTLADRNVDGFISPVTGTVSGAIQRLRFKTFPDFLLIQAQKFTATDNGLTLKKLDIDLDIENEIDLEPWRAPISPQPGEVLLPDEEEGNKLDEHAVEQLVSMGFPPSACRKAVYLTGNKGAEVASEWLMTHIEDADFANEHPDLIKKNTNTETSRQENELISLGFTAHQARYALRLTNGEVNGAAEWLFSSADLVPTMEEESRSVAKAKSTMRNGSGRYHLIGFISHMGTSVHSGHYVAHLFKEGRWVLFNDEKVAVSQHPPRSMAYIYLFRRV